MESRHRAPQGIEARAGELGRCSEVEPADDGPDVDVIAHREIEGARRAPATDLDIVGVGFPDRNARLRKIRHTEQPIAQSFLDIRKLAFERRELVPDTANLTHQWSGVLAPALCSADCLRERVALRLQLLRAGLDRLSLGFRDLE